MLKFECPKCRKPSVIKIRTGRNIDQIKCAECGYVVTETKRNQV